MVSFYRKKIFEFLGWIGELESHENISLQLLTLPEDFITILLIPEDFLNRWNMVNH